MNIIRKFQASTKKYLAEADQRADKRLANARTKTEREKIKASIQRERLETKREIVEAKTALLHAEAKRKKAAKEVSDIGGGSIYSQVQDFLYPKKARRSTRQRTTKRK